MSSVKAVLQEGCSEIDLFFSELLLSKKIHYQASESRSGVGGGGVSVFKGRHTL